MRTIILHIDNGEKIKLKDNDTTDLSSYSEKLASVLEETNVVIIKTSESVAILRPTRINGIEVFPSNENFPYKKPEKETTNKIKELLKTKKPTKSKKKPVKATPANNVKKKEEQKPTPKKESSIKVKEDILTDGD